MHRVYQFINFVTDRISRKLIDPTMKSLTAVVYISTLVFSISCTSSGSLTREQRKDIKAENMQEGLKIMSELLNSGTYLFTAQSATTSGGRTIQLNSNIYTLAVKDQMVKAYLPYYGRAYTSDYSADPGMKFEGEPVEMAIKENEKKGNITVSYRVKTSGETYDITMIVSSSGFGSVSVISRNRQSISYYGNMTEMPENYKF